MNCKHCGSKYTELRSTTEEFGKITYSFYCQSCKKPFTKDVARAAASGQWLMTFRDQKPPYGTRDIAEVYRQSNGSLEINLQVKNACIFSKGPLNFSVRKIESFTTVYYLWLDTLRSTFDSNGVIITVEEIEMNPQLTQEALKNDAMRSLHVRDNLFVIREQRSPVLLNDVLAWLCTALGSNVKERGCYVATCVYGSYDCPEVWTLRRFRDETLAATWYGRAFIRLYYAVSPTLVKWFGHTTWFRTFWKQRLDHMVASLRARGVESSRYNDRPW